MSGALKPEMPPFFGTSLRDLIECPGRCAPSAVAHWVGVPNVIRSLFDTLEKALKGIQTASPNGGQKEVQAELFSSSVTVHNLVSFRLSLENEASIHPRTPPHALLCCLLQWLMELPEPLLGYEMYDAYQACQRDIESAEHRLRNFSLLVDSAPWYSKPTLHLLMGFLTMLGDSEMAANIFACCLLRPAEYSVLVHTPVGDEPFHSVGGSPSARSLDTIVHATAAIGPVAEVLIRHSAVIFEQIRSHVETLQEALDEKAALICGIQTSTLRFLSDEGQDVAEAGMRELWAELKVSEDQLKAGKSAGEGGVGEGEEEWVEYPRWQVCFPRAFQHSRRENGSDVLSLFDSMPGGLLAVKSLASFLHRCVLTCTC